MKAAKTSKRFLDQSNLVFISNDKIQHKAVKDIQNYFNKGDLLVVNRSATLPSSFEGKILRSAEALEIRLAAFQGPSSKDLRNWKAVSFGQGDWRVPTEKRGFAPEILAGDVVVIGEDLTIKIIDVSEKRILTICFESSSLLKNLYKYGKPIQYSYLKDDLNIWDQQTIFSGPPISVEPPSSAFQLSWQRVLELKNKGVQIASLLHSAGLSSTGDPELDLKLPFTEWYEVPEKTLKMIQATKLKGGKVIALGTTVIRALESAKESGLTNLKISENFNYQAVDGLISGIHELGSSHMQILNSLCHNDLVNKAYKQAEQKGYRGHEYGDLSFLKCVN